jgi:hypothetical protein
VLGHTASDVVCPCPPVLCLQVEPYFCYLIMATQLAVYAAGTWLAVAQGPEAAEQMARELAMQPQAGVQDQCTVPAS